jgi:hypothetical protein
MRRWIGAVAVAAALAAVLLRPDGSTAPTAPRPAATTPLPAPAVSAQARAGCSMQSEASFPGAYTSDRNLVVGPLVLVDAAFTDPQTVRDYGGNKFPLLVEAGHTVTVRVGSPDARLAYGPLPQGEIELRDAYESVTFVACRAGRADSYADDVNVTFWSGFVLAREPACVPLEIFVDGSRSPRRAGLQLGRRC